MNTREIAFVICKNNSLWYEECIRYIQDLHVPEGYNIDIISIEKVESMAAAYNAAMDASEAKYKVYLHQDVFILNRDFIADILKIFQEDNSVGMIGMVGCRELPAGSECCNHWDTGRVLAYDGTNVQDLDLRKCQDNDADCVIVEAIDGFIMATQYDYKWQEEVRDGWHRCDFPQVLEMQRHERRVVVPYQAEPWCYHDCEAENEEELEQIYTRLTKIVEAGAFDMIWSIVDEIRDQNNREIREIANLAEIYALEKTSIQGVSSVWWILSSWSEIYGYYNQVRFTLLRMEYQREDERIDLLKKMVENGNLHKDAVLNLASRTLVCSDHVYHVLLKRKREAPLVSVILPVYNGADFVGKTIESILNQTYTNIELIIVDDASTDHSREVIRSYSDSRIRTIFCEKNRNVVYSGNKGFEATKGKYIALIGHDDLWKSDKLEKQVAFLEEHPSYCACFSYIDVIDEDLKIVKDSFFYGLFSRKNRSAEAWIRELFMEGNCFCAPSACIRKTVLDKVGHYRYALVQLQDYDLWLRLFLEGEVYIYPEILTYYRRFNNRKNLSVINEETQVRSGHEDQYIRSSYVNSMPKDTFVKIFSKYMQNANARDEKEILCEKMILLWNAEIYLARYGFADLLEDEECRKILEEKYQLDLNSFYRLNALSTGFES